MTDQTTPAEPHDYLAAMQAEYNAKPLTERLLDYFDESDMECLPPVILEALAKLADAEQARDEAISVAGANAAAYDEARAEARRLHTWDGLMSLLDEHWPEAILPTLPDEPARDAGSRIVSLIRWIEMLHTETRRLGVSLAETIQERQQLRTRLADAEQTRSAALAVAEDLTEDLAEARAELTAMLKETSGTAEARAAGWDEGYALGVNDERTAEDNIGIAGFGMKVLPARENPYRTAERVETTTHADPEPHGLAAIRDRVKSDTILTEAEIDGASSGWIELMQARRDRAELLSALDTELDEQTRPVTAESLSDDILAAMRDRSQGIDCAREAYDSAEDVPRLLAEVDRLRAELRNEGQLREAYQLASELARETNRELRAENARLAAQDRASGPETTGGHPSEGPAPTGLPGAAQGPAPLTLAQAAGHLHDWAGDLAGGARTDWPAGHPDVIRGIRAAAEWLDARDRYETETREQHLTALREAGRRLGESFQQLGEAIRDGAAKARAAREAEETPDVDGWTIYPAFDGGGVMVSHDTDADRPTLGALDSIPLAAVLAFIADAAEETPEPGERTE